MARDLTIGRLQGSGRGGLEDRIAYVAAGGLVPARARRPKVHIGVQRGPPRVHLRTPDALALGGAWHLEQNLRTDTPLERRVEVRRQVGGEDDDAAKRLQLLE